MVRSLPGVLTVLLLGWSPGCGGGGDSSPPPPETEALTGYVNPVIGTGGQGWFAGSALVGATLPFGLVQASPDTELGGEGALTWNHCSGYHADDDRVRAFSHTHLHGTGIPDLGAIGFMAVPGPMDAVRIGRGHHSRFTKATEAVRPGYYAVALDSHGIRAELTVTDRAAVHRYAFVDGAAGRMTLLLDLSHTLPGGRVLDGAVEVDPERGEVRAAARNSNGFSVAYGGLWHHVLARVDRPVAAAGTWAGSRVSPGGSAATGAGAGGYLEVDLAAGEALEVRVGVSYLDAAGARANLEAEIPDGDGFDAVLARAEAAWAEVLGGLRVAGGTDAQRTVLGTALYHTVLMPTLFSDADGRYLGFDGQVHTAEGTGVYTNFSLWDTYRSLHSLLILIAPERQRDFARTLTAMAAQGGHLPRWPLGNGYSNIMIGTPADIVLAESVLKGVDDFDVDAAFAAMTRTATTPVEPGHPYSGRWGVEDYLGLGYVAADHEGASVAVTQEYAVADFAIANLAAALGRADDAARFRELSRTYRNLWNAAEGFFWPRNADGSWVTPFDPMDAAMLDSPYTEGSGLQYVWLVPQDPFDLMALLGGPEAMAARLDAFFTDGADELAGAFSEPHEPLWWILNHQQHYWHGNEPDIHAAYLFLQAGRPDLTQRWVRWIMDTLYTTAADGIPGNDDAGTLAAWYVFSALGLFPVFGSDLYLVGTPGFPYAELDLGAGGTLVIDAPAASSENLYVRGVTLDGEPLDVPWFRHAAIAGGATLRFDLASEPQAWGRVPADTPIPTVPAAPRGARHAPW